MARIWPFLFECLIAVVLCGCVAKLSDATTSESLTAAAIWGVVWSRGLVSEPCGHSTIKLAHRNGDVYEHAAVLFQPAGLSVVHVELDPGEYHVVSWTCALGRETKILGQGAWDGTYSKSLAHFEVRAGEIINLGALNMIEIAPRTVYLAVSDLPAPIQEKFRQEFPQLAARMQTRLLEVPMPTLSPADRALYCLGINRFHQKWKLPQHPACATTVPPLADIDPGKPALFYRP